MNLINLLISQQIKFKINIDFKHGHISLINCKEIPTHILNFVDSYVYTGNFCNIVLKQATFEELNNTWCIDNKKGKIHIEYGSFNPTSIPHLGNFRNLCIGLMIKNIFEVLGMYTYSEFYVNDLGKQVSNLTSYKQTMTLLNDRNMDTTIENVIILIKEQLDRIGIKFNSWQFESKLYDNFHSWLDYSGLIPITKENDRFMCMGKYLQKVDLTPTYAGSDLLYILKKQEQQFDKYFVCLGTDNKSEILFMQEAAKYLNFPLNIIEYNTVLLNGRLLSKRENNIISWEEIEHPFFVLYLFFNSFNLNTQIDLVNINFLLQNFYKSKLGPKYLKNEQITLLMYKLKLCLEDINITKNLALLTGILTNLYDVQTDHPLYVLHKDKINKLIYI